LRPCAVQEATVTAFCRLALHLALEPQSRKARGGHLLTAFGASARLHRDCCPRDDRERPGTVDRLSPASPPAVSSFPRSLLPGSTPPPASA
jgi:hypothetical protein